MSLIQETRIVSPAPYVTIPVASTMTGLSEKAIRRKIEEGKWLDGREFCRSPDGGVFISIEGFASWVKQGLTSARTRSALPSH